MANPKIVFEGVDGVSEVARRVGNSITALKGVIAGVVANEVVQGFVAIVESVKALGDAAQSAGLAVETLSSLRYAAVQSGVGVEELDVALKSLNVRLADVANGSKESIEIFKSLGIRAVNSSGQVLNAAEALEQIADKFARLRNGPEKAALAVELFGKSGYKLIPFLNKGSAGMAELREEAARLGVVIGGDVVTEISKFEDELGKLKAASEAAKIGLVADIVPALTQAIEQFNAARKAADGLGQALWFLAKQSKETLQDPGEKLRQISEDIDRKQGQLGTPGARNPQVAGSLYSQLESMRRERKFLQELQRNQALANYKDDRGDPNLNRFREIYKPGKRGGAEDKQQISESRNALAQFVEELQKESDKLEEITTKERILRFLRANPSVDTKQVREMLAAEEQMLDLRKRAVAAKKEDQEIEAKITAQIKATDDQLDTFSGRAADALKMAQTARLEARLAAGEVFSKEELDKMVKGIGGIKEEIDDTTKYAERFAMTMSSSLGELITAGGSASDVFKALAQDVLKLITQMLILEPIADSLKSLFKGGGGVSSSSGMPNWLDSILWSFMGGMAGGGTLSPGQWAVVGEKGPELAFGGTSGKTIVPSIGMSGVNITQNIRIDARSDIGSIRQAMEISKRQAQAEILESMRRRGSFARA